MGLEIKFDSVAFREEFQKRVLRSRRTIGEVTNEIAFQILKRWQQYIPTAKRSIIEALGITYRTVDKKGKTLKRRQAIYNPTTTFKLIALKEMWMRGPKPRTFANREQLEDVIRKKLGRRSSSVGFVASGPVPALRALVRAVHGGSLTGRMTKSFKGTKGRATVADESEWTPFVEFENATGMNGPNQSAVSQARVERSLTATLERALGDVTQDMADHAAERIERTLQGE